MKKRINESIMLMRILVVMGRYILKFPRSIIMSPGNLPGSGTLGKKWTMMPVISIMIPAMIKNFPIFKNIKLSVHA